MHFYNNNNALLSDSILNSYKLSRSSGSLQAPPNLTSKKLSLICRTNSGTMLSSVKSDCGGGNCANASFNVIQRSASVKQDIVLCIAKLSECLGMVETMNVTSGNENDNMNALEQHQHHHHQQQQHEQCYTLNHNSAKRKRKDSIEFSAKRKKIDLIEFCLVEVKQNISKLALYVQDDYYRIVAGNTNGIETIIQVMNTFSLYEEKLAATCNLTLGILCQSSPLYQLKFMRASGILSIVASIERFPTNESVCSTAVDALVNITRNNSQTILKLCQVQNITLLLHSINNFLHPLSRQNKEILLSQLSAQE